MQVPRPECRVDPDRSISVFGPLNDELASLITRQIFDLRKPPNDEKPITVFINSEGGDIRVLEIIAGALNCKDQNGKEVPVITVVVGNAASAAADLLVYGDYAIAYPHSSIYFHGVRYGEIRQITAERAGVTTENLRKLNLKISYELARAMIPRIVHRYAILRGNFKRRRKGITDKTMAELERFVDALRTNVEPHTFKIVTQSLEHVRQARRLVESILPKALGVMGSPVIKQDERILCTLIRHEIKERAHGEWRLDEDGLAVIVNDYLILRDYLIGDHRGAVRRIIREFGVEFLTESEYKRLLKIKDHKKAEEYVRTKVRNEIDIFWYFAVTLCRNLLRDENEISPRDAYWIGAIDEVVGKLHGKRLPEETVPESIAPAPSAGASVATPSQASVAPM